METVIAHSLFCFQRHVDPVVFVRGQFYKDFFAPLLFYSFSWLHLFKVVVNFAVENGAYERRPCVQAGWRDGVFFVLKITNKGVVTIVFVKVSLKGRRDHRTLYNKKDFTYLLSTHYFGYTWGYLLYHISTLHFFYTSCKRFRLRLAIDCKTSADNCLLRFFCDDVADTHFQLSLRFIKL